MRALKLLVPRRKIWRSVKAAWQEAFPAEVDAAQIIQERKAKMRQEREIREAEYTAEELEAFSKAIPEWKRSALVFVRKLDDPNLPRTKPKPFIRNYLREKYKDNKDFMAG